MCLKARKRSFNAQTVFVDESPSGIRLYRVERALTVSCPICGITMTSPKKNEYFCPDCGVLSK